MNKDTIYIDVEDDITAIIGKVKSAKNKIVALVPPKRTGVLQSAVNLRLLARAAKQGDKHIVLISGNSALTALAASAGIPSARTLQSKPEMAPLPENEENEADDIIDGADLPIGDLARTAENGSTAEEVSGSAAPAIDSAILANAAEEAPEIVPPASHNQANVTGRKKVKIPNFGSFRKKMAIGVSAGVLLIGFLVWAIWFAPHATIIITARTIESSVNPKVTLATTAATDMTQGTLKAVQQEVKLPATLAFDATGSKEVGDKATGQVIFQNCEAPNTITVPAGTGISAGGLTYITQTAATVSPAAGFGSCSTVGTSAPVAVVAQDIGDDYNVNHGTQFTVAGHANTSNTFYFRAVASTDITGGSKKTVAVVTSDDFQKAVDQFKAQSLDATKKQLTSKFGSTVTVIDASFNVDSSEVTSSPAVDGEADDGKAKLAGTLDFTMTGVAKSESSSFLDAYFAKQLQGKDDQRVYNNGGDKVSFVDVTRADSGAYTATLAATAKIGPKIDDSAVKAGAEGKRLGDVQSSLQQISGVEDVDVKFSPFWVSKVPKDEKRIVIEFKLDESK